MLIALLTILFLGGGGSGTLDFVAETKDTVKVVMEKDDRRKEALSTLKMMKKRATAHSKVIKTTSKDLGKALGSDEITDADFDTIWYRYFAQRDSYNSDMLDLRFQLKDQMTREEWVQVFGAQ
jgi:spermidine synthase